VDIDLQPYYAKLAAQESLSENEVGNLLAALAIAQKAVAYLAECQAATLESLPKSASRANRSRHVAICEVAAKAMCGNLSGIRYPGTIAAAVSRCENAVRAAYPS
jgi:hypothetical protein